MVKTVLNTYKINLSKNRRPVPTLDSFNKIIDLLNKKKINLNDFIALEFFAREGDWHTIAYSNIVKELYAWEIDSQFIKNLKKNLPNAIIENGNSFELSRRKKYKNYFDLIVIDNPQNVFNGYCEHFDAIERVNFLLKDKGIVIFNINVRPYNLKENILWNRRRIDYYKNTSKILNLKFIYNFYKNKFNEFNFNVIDIFHQKRHENFLFYLVLILEKK